ncbi:amino acid adenylation domain-containing protein [Actinomadura sp. 1N219]|uniref:amino acid adenylation domain-containing protein n=1 Tax=Actinomadura sp. 1N219 TaxID=3375152 RepID=UPI0037B70E3B
MTTVPAPERVPPLPDLIAERAAAHGAATAIRQGATSWTYRRLLETADRIAAALLRRGLRPEDRVLVAAPRSPHLVAALLGVARAGGAYVPVDRDQPPDRLAAIVAGSGAALCLADPARPPEGFAGSVVPLREAAEAAEGTEAAGAAAERVRLPGIDPRTAAYVLYTSGSTGRPKGVVIEHRSLSNYLAWCADGYDLGSGSGAPVHSPLTFDLTVTSLFGPLAAGRTVTLAADGAAIPLEELGRTLTGGGYSLVKITPAHLEVLDFLIPADALPAVTRRLVVGGEQLHGRMAARWRRLAPGTVLVNEYGPTEATVGCCVYASDVADLPDGPVPIGGPIPGVRLYVVEPDDPLRPVPPGAVGELVIAGDCLARGYLDAPAQTAARFVPDPFHGSGERMYRTGDLVRRDDRGDLVFQGRLDRQVKINGHRVELDEIVAALRAVPGVGAATVLASAGRARTSVTAYAEWRGGGDPPPAAEVVSALRRRLPRHMMPSVLVWLESLPLTPNGKTDDARLPDAAPARRDELAGLPR